MSTGLAATPWPDSIGPGYWQRLDALVRSEFRVDLYRPAHDDPILRRERACGVPGCRTAVGPDDHYCRRHERLWREAGEPAHDDFLAMTPPTEPARISGGRICAVIACTNPQWAHGWCRAHDNMWKRRRRPAGFAEEAPKVRQARFCRVPNCGRPEAVIAYGLCSSHRRHWAEEGEPPLDVFLRRAKAVRNIEVVYSFLGLPPGPKLELQFVLQQRRDALGARIRPKPFVTVVEAVRAQGESCRSVLDYPLEHWEAIVGEARESTPGRNGSGLNLGFLRWTYGESALLADDDPFAPTCGRHGGSNPGNERTSG